MTTDTTEPEPSPERSDLSAAEPGARAIPLGLGGLAAGIANIGGLTVTVDGVPDAARLSAGQFLGDGTWSVRASELGGLTLHPSPGRNRNCRLSVRLRKIDKDMGDAFSIGAVYVDVDGDAGRAVIAGTDGAISLRREGPAQDKTPSEAKAPPKTPQPEPVRRIVRPARKPPVSTDTAARPASPAPAPTPSEMPSRTMPARDTTDLGIAPPDAVAAPAGDSAIVQVHVASGLRVGRFGKTGRPDEVVSVRGRGTDTLRTGEAARGSIVFLGQGGKRPPSP